MAMRFLLWAQVILSLGAEAARAADACPGPEIRHKYPVHSDEVEKVWSNAGIVTGSSLPEGSERYLANLATRLKLKPPPELVAKEPPCPSRALKSGYPCASRLDWDWNMTLLNGVNNVEWIARCTYFPLSGIGGPPDPGSQPAK
jgi:hypothetical protein